MYKIAGLVEEKRLIQEKETLTFSRAFQETKAKICLSSLNKSTKTSQQKIYANLMKEKRIFKPKFPIKDARQPKEPDKEQLTKKNQKRKLREKIWRNLRNN